MKSGTAQVGKYFSNKFPAKNGVKQGDALLTLIFSSLL
jgi:hypothetical protein